MAADATRDTAEVHISTYIDLLERTVVLINLCMHRYYEIAQKYDHMKREQQRHQGGAGVAAEDVTMEELLASGPGMTILRSILSTL